MTSGGPRSSSLTATNAGEDTPPPQATTETPTRAGSRGRGSGCTPRTRGCRSAPRTPPGRPADRTLAASGRLTGCGSGTASGPALSDEGSGSGCGSGSGSGCGSGCACCSGSTSGSPGSGSGSGAGSASASGSVSGRWPPPAPARGRRRGAGRRGPAGRPRRPGTAYCVPSGVHHGAVGVVVEPPLEGARLVPLVEDPAGSVAGAFAAPSPTQPDCSASRDSPGILARSLRLRVGSPDAAVASPLGSWTTSEEPGATQALRGR